MKAKFINESIVLNSVYTIDNLIQELESDKQYQYYTRYMGLITGTILQVANELNTNEELINAVVVKKEELASCNAQNEYISQFKPEYQLICNIGEDCATIQFAYNKEYAHKLYGSSYIQPIYIILSL